MKANEVAIRRFDNAMASFEEKPKKSNLIVLTKNDPYLVYGAEGTIPIIKYEGYYIQEDGTTASLRGGDFYILFPKGEKGVMYDKKRGKCSCWQYKSENTLKFSLVLWLKTDIYEFLYWYSQNGNTYFMEDELLEQDHCSDEANQEEMPKMYELYSCIKHQHFIRKQPSLQDAPASNKSDPFNLGDRIDELSSKCNEIADNYFYYEEDMKEEREDDWFEETNI